MIAINVVANMANPVYRSMSIFGKKLSFFSFSKSSVVMISLPDLN